VMQADVWLATAVFTVTTLAFYWLGAGILHRDRLIPTDDQMVVTIQNIYTGSLGTWAAALFLVGSFFVLYSTIFSGTAGGTRMYADALGVFGLVDFGDFRACLRWIRTFTVLIPAVHATVYIIYPRPTTLLVFTAALNGVLIPVIAFATIWLRRRGTDPRIGPGPVTDAALWLCSLVILAVSTVYVYFQFGKLFGA